MHVLVVDDTRDIRFMLRVLLEGADMEVEEASSGAAAIERLLDATRDAPDAAVLDQRMPDMTGIEVARALDERGARIPLVLFSAYLHPDLRAEARALGAVPVGKTDLSELVGALRDLEACPA